MSSWDHTLQKLSDEQREHLREWEQVCRLHKSCHQPVTHLATYRYVTGRGGRVGWRSRYMCDTHAGRFRAKHELPEPRVQATPKHTLQRILEGGDQA